MGDIGTAPGYLTGSARPVEREVEALDLPVTGRLPEALTGVYVRNGPNPTSGDPGHWFFGDGMLHGVRIEGGRAAWYRNRWVRTPTFTDGVPVRDPETGAPHYEAGAANTSVVRHAGRTMALVESSFPHLVDESLETIGPYDFDGRLTTAMTAHPKADPVTGELHFFGYDLFEPYVTYHRAGADGRLELSRPIEVPGPTMIHDMLLTEHHVVFMDLPVVFDLELAMGGSMPFRWDDDYGARLGLLDRDDPTGPVRWVEVQPGYVFHGLNAYEEEGHLVAHVVRYPELWRRGTMDFAPTALWRWQVDLATGRVTEGPVDDLACEMPRIDERLLGRRTDRGWVVGERDGVKGFAAYDLRTGASTWAPAGAGRVPSEPTFVAADDRAGGPGWLMAYVYDGATDASELCVWDADDIASPPVARVALPQRVPDGFHGTWLPDGG